MSNTASPPFKPINFAQVQSAVKDVVKEKNIPRLAYPGEQPVVPSPAPVPAVEVKDTPTVAKRAPKKSGPAKMVRTAVDLPDYLLKAIAKESVEKGVTKRYLYLTAFRAAGFTIQDTDMQEDGRRDAAA